jgi:uncharacterized protein DUF6268
VRLTLTGIFFLLLSSLAPAQESIDLVTLSIRYGAPRPYKSQFPGKATEIVGLVNIKLPIVINKSIIWYNDILYSPAIVNSTEPLPEAAVNPIKVHGFIFQTGVVKKFDNGTAIQLLFVPRHMTDFVDTDSKNWQLGAIGLFEKRYSTKLMMRFGVLYNMELFGPIITPLVHLDWRIADKWSIVGLLPIYAKINYHYSKNLIMGLSHFGFTTTYRLGEPAHLNDYIERSSIDLSLFIRQRIVGNIHIEGRLGHSLTRIYAQYAEDQKIDLSLIIFNFGDNRVQKNENFKDGIFANLRLVYNLPI